MPLLKFYLFVVLSIFCLKASSQTVTSCVGRVLTINKSGVPYATLFYQSDSTKNTTGVTADDRGRFVLPNLAPTSYTITVSSIGFNRKVISHKPGKDSLFIYLEENTNLTSGVTVIGKKPIFERKIDRLTFNISESTAALGTDAHELLDKIPGVRVQENSIAIAGKSGVRVMIDDRMIEVSGDALVSLLKSIPSNQIESIELITNPPAKYDASGNAGIIRVVTKRKNTQGYSGYARLVERVATYAATDLSASLKITGNNLQMDSNMGLVKGSIQVLQEANINNATQLWQQQSVRKQFQDAFTGNLGLDYLITKKATIGISLRASKRMPSLKEQVDIRLLDARNKLDSLLLTTATTAREQSYYSGNLHYIAKLDSLGKTIAINADYLNYGDENVRNFQTSTLIDNPNSDPSTKRVLTAANQEIKIYTLKGDVDVPSDLALLSFGGKISFISSSSDNASKYLAGEINDDLTNQSRFTYDEQLQSLYVSGTKTLGKWELKAGLRGELTTTTGTSITLAEKYSFRYLNVFPTLYLSYKANDNNTISSTFGRRITRPNYEFLNPFRWYTSPYSYYEGNPFLRPSYTNNFELIHSYKDLLTTTLYYSNTANEIEQLTLQDGRHLSTKYFNTVNYTTVGITAAVTKYYFDWWQSYSQVQPYYTRVTPQPGLGIRRQENISAYLSTSNTFSINKTKGISASLSTWYQLPEASGAYYSRGFGNVTLGFKYTLYKKKITGTVAIADVFRMQVQRNESFLNGEQQQYKNYSDNRRITFSFIYKFGKDKPSTNNQESNIEEKGRL